MPYQVTLLLDYSPPSTSDPKATVDYHRSRRIVPVEPGQPVARLEQLPEQATPDSGIALLEKPEELLTEGVELSRNNDELLVISRKKGFPALLHKQLHIFDHYIVEGDVNFHTSNIECQGDLLIQGSIMAGFKVKADRLTVLGNIENADIECRGDLACLGGIIACQEKPLLCHGSLWCKYLENSTIDAHGNIFIAKSSLHSFLKAGENVILCSCDAVLVGGRCECGHSLYTATLGAKWATPTEIILGCEPFLARKLDSSRRELAELEQEQAELQERIEQINTFLQQPDHNRATSEEIHLLQEERELNEGKIVMLGSRRETLRLRCQELETRVAAHKTTVDHVTLTVTNRLFSGIQLTIKDTETRITEENGAVKLGLNPENNDEIVAIAEKS